VCVCVCAPPGHAATYLIQHLCADRERVLFPPTTDGHFSDAGDNIGALAATLRPWNSSLAGLTDALLEPHHLGRDAAHLLHEHLSVLLSACRALIDAAQDLRVAALACGDDPTEALLPLDTGGAVAPRTHAQVAELEDAAPGYARIDCPLRWIRQCLAAGSMVWPAPTHGCCFCAALADFPAACPPPPGVDTRPPAQTAPPPEDHGVSSSDLVGAAAPGDSAAPGLDKPGRPAYSGSVCLSESDTERAPSPSGQAGRGSAPAPLPDALPLGRPARGVVQSACWCRRPVPDCRPRRLGLAVLCQPTARAGASLCSGNTTAPRAAVHLGSPALEKRAPVGSKSGIAARAHSVAN
jgi:hypothetical protein